MLLASGANVKAVSTRLGHGSPAITLGVYAHTLPGADAALAASFAAMLEPVEDVAVSK